MPLARTQIERWTALAHKIPDQQLREQALSSLASKRFHADGGCVYAAANMAYATTLVELIVALQTISDYLDNLCDRCDIYDEQDFNCLHNSMRDAVVPGAPLRDYYAYRNHPDDGGYLSALVTTCQKAVGSLPNYALVQHQVAWYVDRYSELQSYKHIEPSLRQDRLVEWSRPYVAEMHGIHWWEFAAATGSTLGMFALFLFATLDLEEADVASLHKAYFPWVSGLHILLDYLIDLDEDEREGDFNFVACYKNPSIARDRLRVFAEESWRQSTRLRLGGKIHKFVVQGLLAMYLSDVKVTTQRQVRKARRMLIHFGPTAWVFYAATRLYRVVR